MKKILIPLFALGAALAVQPALAADGEALFKSKPCVACHTVDNKMVGPALKEVAAKMLALKARLKRLALHIKMVAPVFGVQSQCQQTQ